jgi:hypothetical protein
MESSRDFPVSLAPESGKVDSISLVPAKKELFTALIDAAIARPCSVLVQCEVKRARSALASGNAIFGEPVWDDIFPMQGGWWNSARAQNALKFTPST